MEHKLYQNIFLEAYGNPATAEALSLELGIALPYMEDELDYLVRETFLIKKDGKYETAFPIISRTAQEQAHSAQLAAAPQLTKSLADFVDRFHRAFEAMDFAYYGTYQDYESAKWALLMLAYDHFFYSPRTRAFTDRPDGGRWDMVGYQYCKMKESCFVGNHGGNYGFQQFKYEFDGIADRTPLYLTDAECKALRDLAVGNTEVTDDEVLAALTSYGYLHRDGEAYCPQILTLNIPKIKDAVGKFNEETAAELTSLSDQIKKQMKALYDAIADAIKSDLPVFFSHDEYQCELAISCCYHARGYVMEEALRSGWLHPADQLSPAIGAHLYLK